MTSKHKPLGQQVLVLTGASSGIGLALLAAERGASLVLAARSEDTLRTAVSQIVETGGVISVITDVGDEDQVSTFDTNFWGVVNGSLCAQSHLRNSGGACDIYYGWRG